MKSKLTLNRSTGPLPMQSLVCNLVPQGCRLETLEGRNYTVVPMVIMCEGVHVGSDGPLLYPIEELSKTPAVWNHKPIVVYHPESNGQGISACDPVVLQNRKVGMMLNTVYENGRLKSEAWIEKDRAAEVDSRILTAIEKKEMMELSTGLFIDVDRTPGKWRSEEYDGVARNFRPDHLALLPDQIGACSISDGAGFFRNAARGKKNLVTNAMRAMFPGISHFIFNEMSYSNINEALRTAVQNKFAANDPNMFVWVEDVYSNFVIYSLDGKLFRLGYKASENSVTLSEDAPSEVKRVTEYRTIDGAFVGNRNRETTNNDMNKKEVVDAIIANTRSGWTEADRTTLMTLNEAQLGTIKTGLITPAPAGQPANNQQVPTAPAPAPAAATAPAPATPPAPATATTNQNQPPRQLTTAEFIAMLPPDIASAMTMNLGMHAQEKENLIVAITANANNGFTKDQLNAMSLDTLRGMARLSGTVVRPPIYGGQAPSSLAAPEEEGMALPEMTFTKK